jgi:hypothetical protein
MDARTRKHRGWSSNPLVQLRFLIAELICVELERSPFPTDSLEVVAR